MTLSKPEICELLTDEQNEDKLFKQADAVRKQNVGD